MLAHELSHIAHRDVAVITIAFVPGRAGRGFILVRFTLLQHADRQEHRAQHPAILAVIAGVMVVSATVYTLCFLLIRTLSRYRELAADRAGVMLTGRPSQLAAAR